MGASGSSSSSAATTSSSSASAAAAAPAAPAPPPLDPMFAQGGPETAGMSRDLNGYAIRLEAEQSLALYGYFTPKKTLTWHDVLQSPKIHLSACIACGVPVAKLHRMQPDIKEWIRCGKATVNECEHMAQWRPNPFTDLGCSIGDLVLYRRALPASLLIDSGVTFTQMKARYGLTADLMFFLKYSAEDWIRLGIEEEFALQMTHEQWTRVFGLMTRSELVAQLKKRNFNQAYNQ